MAWKPEKKAQSRALILEAAASLFTARGFDEVTIDDVMQEAQLTRGAFYAHFSSKSELYGESIINAAKQAKERLFSLPNLTPSLMAEHYLNIGRGCGPQKFCVLAFLVSDINHRDDAVKRTYTRILGGYIEIMQSTGLDSAAATQASIVLIGGLALAKAVNDETLAQSILDNCQLAVENIQRASLEPTSTS